MGSLVIEYLNKMGSQIGPLVYIARHCGCVAWVIRERAYVAFDEHLRLLTAILQPFVAQGRNDR